MGNKAMHLQPMMESHRRPADAAKRFLNAYVYEAGVLLRDERLSYSVRLRKPVVLAYPKSQITSSPAALAAKLGNGLAVRTADEGFF